MSAGQVASAARNRYDSLMSGEELRERMRAHIAAWEETGRLLEAERRIRVRETDTAEALRRLGRLFNSAVRLHPPSPTSGLVEFQATLARGRR